MWGSGAAGLGDSRDEALRLERARLPAGDRGGPCGAAAHAGAGLGSAMLQLSPGKTPARRREAGQLVGTAGTKAARGRMQSWKNPTGRRGGGGRGEAVRAPQPCHLRQAARAGLLPAPAPERSERAERGGPGRQKMLDREGRPVPADREPVARMLRMLSAARRGKGGPDWHSAHAALHTATWQLRQSVAASRLTFCCFEPNIPTSYLRAFEFAWLMLVLQTGGKSVAQPGQERGCEPGHPAKPPRLCC
ncbi:uncharacterized protein LOC122241050 isoform X2 [Panthera tigris]|uniref:uncharacterized protein LOC122241050 isoform X2 n=1 Tax=Panthera tigris TaxID=9694 RepID=UPI001C6F7439|nr:uncharacterized protein LOC122241050 isoform X2 [Panthera tigris]